MYILKNVLRNLTRSKGRTVLVAIIVLAISFSACIGLSIRQAANTAKEQSLESMQITAQISLDRSSMMQDFGGAPEEGQEFDISGFADRMQEAGSLTLEEMETYAQAASVEDFYYSLSVSLNGADGLEPVSTDTSTDTEDAEDTTDSDSAMPDMGGGPGGMQDMPGGGPGGFQRGGWGTQGDFTVVGYGSDAAMTDFINGTSTITDGAMFEENTGEAQCVISDELATYNALAVGDTIAVENPNNEGETYTFQIVGIYNNSQSTVTTGGMMGGFSTANDPANQIYTGYAALKAVTEASEAAAVTSTDEETGRETTTAIPEQLSGTYAFASVKDYEAFEAEARALGLDDSYTITSSDLTAFEQSMLPLENLSQMALYFLLVVLGIGALVLIVLNIFNVRERKYEIGVLTAIGMKKRKVALQFITEIFIVTFFAIVVGGAAGAVSSVPVTNSLLASQTQSQADTADRQEAGFGRPVGGPEADQGGGPGGEQGDVPALPDGGEPGGNMLRNYVTEVTSATNITVLLQLLGLGILLTIVASGASVVFIMRYEPLKILSNRD